MTAHHKQREKISGQMMVAATWTRSSERKASYPLHFLRIGEREKGKQLETLGSLQPDKFYILSIVVFSPEGSGSLGSSSFIQYRLCKQ